MVFLLNQTKSQSLISFVNEKVGSTIEDSINKNKSGWTLYIMTCYITKDGLEDLFKSLENTLKQNNINDIEILADKDEWAKIWYGLEDLLETFKQSLNKYELNISINPVDSQKLFHAKSYALIHKNTCEGFLISTSANLTRRGLSYNLEFCNFTEDKDSIRQYFHLFQNAKAKFTLTNKKRRKLEKFAKAYTILSMGRFYYEKDVLETKYHIGLNDQGKKLINNNIGGKTSVAANKKDETTVSYRLIDHVVIKDLLPPLVPTSVINSYSVDTLIGKWIPEYVHEIIQERINFYKNIYIQFVNEEYINDKYINHRKEQMRNDIEDLVKKNYVAEKDFDIDAFIKRCHEKTNEAFTNDESKLDIFFDYHNLKSADLDQMPNSLIKTISRKVNRDVKDSTKGTRKSLKELFKENLENIGNLKEFSIESNELDKISELIGSMKPNDIFSAVISHEKEYKILCGCIFKNYSHYDITDNHDITDNRGRYYIKGLYYLEGKNNISNVEPLLLDINQIMLFKKIDNKYKDFLGLPSEILEESTDQTKN